MLLQCVHLWLPQTAIITQALERHSHIACFILTRLCMRRLYMFHIPVFCSTWSLYLYIFFDLIFIKFYSFPKYVTMFNFDEYNLLLTHPLHINTLKICIPVKQQSDAYWNIHELKAFANNNVCIVFPHYTITIYIYSHAPIISISARNQCLKFLHCCDKIIKCLIYYMGVKSIERETWNSVNKQFDLIILYQMQSGVHTQFHLSANIYI